MGNEQIPDFVDNVCKLAIDATRVRSVNTADDLVGLYRARGYKMTPQRRAVFDVLEGHVGHPTAEAVYAEVVETMPTISLRTVYSVLSELVEIA